MANLKVNRDVSYINRDFSQFREQLINFSQTYFPNTYTDLVGLKILILDHYLITTIG